MVTKLPDHSFDGKRTLLLLRGAHALHRLLVALHGSQLVLGVASQQAGRLLCQPSPTCVVRALSDAHEGLASSSPQVRDLV